MKDSGAGKLHYARFATRWKSIAELRGEKATLILSPHLDDIFLSLYATIVSGKLGKNVIGVNFFTASDSTVSTNVNTSFSTIAKTSILRMSEELAFSRFMFLSGFNYLPVFLGLKEASIGKYYEFIAGGALGRLAKKTGIRKPLWIYDRMVADYSEELDALKSLDPLIRQFKSNIKAVLAPMGVYSQIDHGVIARSALGSLNRKNMGLYAEVPYTYMSGKMSLDKLRESAPKGFGKVMLTNFDPAKKAKLFKTLYPSQYEQRTKEAIFAIGKGLGEVIMWSN